MCIHLIRYCTRSVIEKVNVVSNRRLGACLPDHVMHGSDIEKLVVGDFVEVRTADGLWRLGKVTKSFWDGPVLRYLKVR